MPNFVKKSWEGNVQKQHLLFMNDPSPLLAYFLSGKG